MEKYAKMPFSVLKVSGNSEKLLNGITTNDLSEPRNAFIDVYGKIISVFYQKKIGNEMLIAIPAQFKERVRSHLSKYAMLAKSRIEEIKMKTYFTVRASHDNDSLFIPERKGFILISEKTPRGAEMSEKEFEELRLERGISIQGKEFDTEMIMNTDWKDAVSFTKGCFLGQEIAIKIMHRAKPPKRLVRIFSSSEINKITRNGEKISEIITKTFSQKYNMWIAYCFLPNDAKGIDQAEIRE